MSTATIVRARAKEYENIPADMLCCEGMQQAMRLWDKTPIYECDPSKVTTAETKCPFCGAKTIQKVMFLINSDKFILIAGYDFDEGGA